MRGNDTACVIFEKVHTQLWALAEEGDNNSKLSLIKLWRHEGSAHAWKRLEWEKNHKRSESYCFLSPLAAAVVSLSLGRRQMSTAKWQDSFIRGSCIFHKTWETIVANCLSSDNPMLASKEPPALAHSDVIRGKTQVIFVIQRFPLMRWSMKLAQWP